MKYLIFYIILFFCGAEIAVSQDSNTKYFAAIIHLQNNKIIQDEIRKEFKKEISKDCTINFEVSEKINFISTEVFEDYDFNMDNSLINKEKFYEEYYFESIDNPLKNLLRKSEKSIKIHFGKPIKNFLLLELSTKDYKESNNPKFGKSIKVILFFDENDRVEKSFFETIINN